MSTLQIRKLESGTFKHVDSIDGDFFLGRFNYKNELGKAFLVEAYGAKRREYVIGDISVYDYLGSEELFTNFTDLNNRLTELGYTGIDISPIYPALNFLSNDETTYTAATLPLAGTELALVYQGGAFKKVAVSELKTEKLVTNAAVTGSYAVDWANDVWDLTLTGNTTLTESNLPASGKTKTITLNIVGNFTLTYPADWTDFITGAYSGTATLNTITIQYFGTGKYKVLIVQPD